MKTSIKMIVTDLDGTLLRSDKTISEYTKTVLKKCREAGIKVVYATGRGESMENIVFSDRDLFDGIITANGATAKIGDEVVYSRSIPYLIARPLLMAIDKRGLLAASQTPDTHYANFTVTDVWPEITNFKLTDFSRHDKDAEKLYIYNPVPEDRAFIESLLSDELYLIMAMDGLAMIMHKDATKSKAAGRLASIWGIVPCEIAAFGDDLNDKDMLAYAGIGMAMGNALDEVKAISDFVCLTNDEDGLAKWIEEHIF